VYTFQPRDVNEESSGDEHDNYLRAKFGMPNDGPDPPPLIDSFCPQRLLGLSQ
jgi:hypothetical protein